MRSTIFKGTPHDLELYIPLDLTADPSPDAPFVCCRSLFFSSLMMSPLRNCGILVFALVAIGIRTGIEILCCRYVLTKDIPMKAETSIKM